VGVLVLRWEATLDAVIDQSDEASGNDDTGRAIRRRWGTYLYM
jgi:hypothetical protein